MSYEFILEIFSVVRQESWLWLSAGAQGKKGHFRTLSRIQWGCLCLYYWWHFLLPLQPLLPYLHLYKERLQTLFSLPLLQSSSAPPCFCGPRKPVFPSSPISYLSPRPQPWLSLPSACHSPCLPHATPPARLLLLLP